MTGGAVFPLWASAVLLLPSPQCDTVSVTLITLIVSGSPTVNKPVLWKHLQRHLASLSLKNTHICTHRPPPTQSRTHLSTQNKHTDSTQHSTHCNNFRGMVSLSRGCGERVGREVETGEGSTLCLSLTPKRLAISSVVSREAVRAQYRLMGTCVFRVPVQPLVLCGDVGKQ